jgi:hypothetical protein
MTGGAAVTDVTMSGTITTTISGAMPNGTTPTPQSGTFTLIATAAGQGKSIVTTDSGTRTEIRDISSGIPAVTETGPDGVSHSVTTQSAVSPHPGWFYPLFVLNSALTSTIYASSYVGQETWSGNSVQHLSLWLVPLNSASSPRFGQQATQHEVYVDAASLLPVGLTFTVHPYDPTSPNRTIAPYRNEVIDTLEQVTFSDYQQVQNRSVALHIHTSLRAGATMIVSEIQLTSISFNTGATIAAN